MLVTVSVTVTMAALVKAKEARSTETFIVSAIGPQKKAGDLQLIYS